MKKIFLLIFAAAISLLAAEELFFSRVYRQNSDPRELLFYHYNRNANTDQKTILSHYYVLPDSSIAVIDEVILENGEFRQSQSQFLEVNEIGTVIRRGERMTLRFSKDGKTKEKELDYPPDLLVGPLFNDHIIKNWQSLLAGEKIYFKLPAPDIQQVATFTFEKDEKTEYEKPGHIVFKLDAASFFLRFLVRPSYFVYDLQSRRLMEIHGTTILRTKQNGKWQNSTDVNMYYEYEDK